MSVTEQPAEAGNPTGPRGDGFFAKSQRCPASRPLGSIVSDRIDPELVQDVMGMLLRLDYPFEGIRPVAWGAVHDEVDALVRTDLDMPGPGKNRRLVVAPKDLHPRAFNRDRSLQ
jgi:hypothetical protein